MSHWDRLGRPAIRPPEQPGEDEATPHIEGLTASRNFRLPSVALVSDASSALRFGPSASAFRCRSEPRWGSIAGDYKRNLIASRSSFSWFARRPNETLPLSLILMLLVNVTGQRFAFGVLSLRDIRRVPGSRTAVEPRRERTDCNR